MSELSIGNIEELLQRIKIHNPNTFRHLLRVAVITEKVFTNSEFNKWYTPKEVDIICMGAMLHDIGKIQINNVILDKIGALTEEEEALIRNHVYYSTQLINPLFNGHVKKIIANICFYHHERSDGSGYPLNKKQNEIPLYVNIVSIADAFDALTDERPYRKAYTPDEARKLIIGGGCGIFDKDICDKFFEVI